MRARDADKRVLQDQSVAAGMAAGPVSSAPAESSLNTTEKNELLELDGIYLTSADAELNSDNIKRLEQRLLNGQEYVYFRKDNKELNIDNKLFDPKLIRRTDISLVKNTFHNFIKRNAVICERLNQKKKTYYMIEMFIGRLAVDNHPQFSEEDKLAATLKHQIRKYRDFMDKNLLPHYAQVLHEQSTAYDLLKVEPSTPASDMALISKQIEETKTKMQREHAAMGACMNEAYETWRKIKNIRTMQDFASNPVDLQVQELPGEQGRKEQYLLLKAMAVNEKNTYSNRAIPSAEASRRAKVKACSYYLKIYINGTLMSTSEKKSLEWPSFEIDFKHLFQIFIYTKPYSIAVEVCAAGLFDETIDRVELEIPGDHSNSLTSASSLFRDVPYCKKRLLRAPAQPKKPREAEPKAGGPAGTQFDDKHNSNDPVKQVDPDNKLDQSRKEEALKADEQQDTDSTEAEQPSEVLEGGRISVEVGWKGFGPHLPPLNTGGFGIFRQRKKTKGGYASVPQEEDDLLRDEVLLDVNDPRNYERVERIREIRNNYLRSLLHSDMKVPLNDIPSLRHEFMKLSLLTYDSKIKHMPLLEAEAARNRHIREALVNHFNDKSSLLKENRSSGQEPLNMANVTKVDGFPQSPEAVKRITETKLTFLKKQGEIRVKKNLGVSDTVSLLGVINEFRFGDEENHFLQNLMKIFEPRRKLRPQVSKPKKVSAGQRTECIIVVQAIKGINIPARWKDPPGNQLELSAIQNPDIAASAIRGRGGDSGMASPPVPVRTADGGLVLPDVDGIANADENALFDSEKYKLPSSFVQSVIVEKSKSPDLSQLQIKYSDTFDGTDPEWNENLSLIYKAKHEKGFTNLELLKNEATLYISVFDNFGSYDPHGENAQRFTLKVEKRFLGNIKIPLLSLFVNPKVDAMFRLNRPIYLFGYLSSKAGLFANSQQENLTTIDPFMPTYVMLSLACEPNFELPEADSTDYSPGFEPTQFLLAGKSFLEKFFADPANKGRHLRLWGYNIEGKSIFVPRYITPLKPPEEFYMKDPGVALGTIGNGPGVIDLDDDIYQKCARFVSLIPVKNDNSFFSDMPDIFMTGQEFIDMLAGDFEEHALLLCNYFLYIDHVLKGNKHMESMVILGRGVPEGKTYYVLRRDTKHDKNELWNPVTGDVYVFTQKKLTTKFLCFTCNAGVTQQSGSIDSICPLKFVDAVVSGSNVFINVQKDKSAVATQWDVNNEKCFQPFLSKRATEKFFPKGISTVQTEIAYEDTNPEFLSRLERKIAQYIAEKIENHRFAAAKKDRERAALPTKWNKHFGDQIKHQLLQTFEMFKYSMRPAGIDGVASKAKIDQAAEQMAFIKKSITGLVTGNREIYGFPLNMPFVSVEQIWEEVSNTEIHNILNDDIEFVLSVCIFPYPNYVMSVWVYIAVLYK